MIASYEKIHAVTIPVTYRSALRSINGGDTFEITLFGVPQSMAKQPPLIDRSTAWPLDIGTARTVWRIRYNSAATHFFIGSGPWSADEHLGYFLSPTGRVEALRRGGEQYRSWTDIEEFLNAELQRSEDHYAEHEDRMAQIVTEAGSSSSRRRKGSRRK